MSAEVMSSVLACTGLTMAQVAGEGLLDFGIHFHIYICLCFVKHTTYPVNTYFEE